MFDDLIKELSRLDGQLVSVPLERDEKGYFDKQCPSESCEFIFKIHGEDWSSIVQDEVVWCPLCRHEAPAKSWYTIEQVEHAKAEAFAVLKGRINNAMRSDADKFNRSRPKGGFITMTMKVEGGTRRMHTLPAKAADAMQLEIACEQCNCRFAVVGSAFFCPACGHNSVTRTFSDSLRKIRAKRDSVEIVRKALNEAMGKDEAELTCRSLLETCLSDGVVAFQKYCEGLFEPFGEAPLNVFQRLQQGSELWKEKVQKDYKAWLSENELFRLNILYQRRHLLAHNEGIIDEQYLKKSGDTSYKEGQRIVVSNADIDDLIACLEKLGDGLKSALENP